MVIRQIRPAPPAGPRLADQPRPAPRTAAQYRAPELQVSNQLITLIARLMHDELVQSANQRLMKIHQSVKLRKSVNLANLATPKLAINHDELMNPGGDFRRSKNLRATIYISREIHIPKYSTLGTELIFVGNDLLQALTALQ